MLSSAIQWGNAAEWVSGVLTAVALGVTYLLLRKERASLEILRADRRREQAGLVTAWLEDLGSTEAGRFLVRLHVRNGSEEPVSDVSAECDGWSGLVPFYQREVLPPAMNDATERTVAARPITEHGGFRLSAPAAVTLTFTDARGVRWRRAHNGELQEAATSTHGEAPHG